MKLPLFVTTFALIFNKTKLSQICNTTYWVLSLLLQPLWFRVRVSHPPSHVTHWSCDHVICKKIFLSTFARAQFSTIQGSFLLIYKQELKSEKVTSFFSKSTNLWKKIFISRYDMIMFIYKSWSVNSGWLTLFVRSKVTRGDSFAFKMLLTIISLQEQSF